MLPLVLFILPSVLAAAVPHIARGASNQWVPIFGAAPANHENTPTSQINTPGSVFNSTDAFLVNSTVRETFRVSQATDQLRITVTNRFGSTDLNLDAVTVAIPSPDVPGARAIDAGSLRTVTFQGNSSVKVPPGADWVSDPIFLTVVDGCEISVSTYSASGIARPDLTVHWTGANTAYYVNGDYTQDAAFDGPNLYNDTSSYYVFTVDGWLPTSTGVIACIGDSITDGFQSTPNTNGRWPDRLSDRINADSSAGRYSVVDMGISGNRVLTDNGYFGQNLLARLDHDLLSLPGVTHTILLEGINDLNGGRRVGKLPTAASLIQAYQQFITRAHIRGIAVIGGTITPTAVPAGVNYTTNAFAPSSNAIRLELNDWIRNSGAFDYVVDFDRAVRNASFPDQMQNQYASSDWLHPNNVGYQAMADTFDLSVFGRLKGNVDNYA